MAALSMLSSTIETPSPRSGVPSKKCRGDRAIGGPYHVGCSGPCAVRDSVHFSRGGRTPLLPSCRRLQSRRRPRCRGHWQRPRAIHILLGNGDGTFRQGATYPIAFGFYLATASLRHNGILDLVIGVAANNYVNVVLGIGDGTFQPAVPYPTTAASKMLVLGDFTGHGNIDVLNLEGASAQGPVCNCLEVLPGNGDGTFGAPI